MFASVNTDSMYEPHQTVRAGNREQKQVLFVHSGGAQGPHEGSSDFVTTLQDTLGAGYEVLYPKMPGPEHPEYKRWKEQLTKELEALEDGVILVGHSLGGSVLLKYLSEEPCKKKIAGLYIVASPYWGKKDWQVDEYVLQDDFASKLPPIPVIFLYHSRDDEVVPFKHVTYYAGRLPEATIRMFDNRGHLFSKGLPELVEDIRSLATAH